MSAGAIRAGRTVIEIGADPKAYLAALDRLRTHIRNVGVQINNAGVAMVGLGTAATAPFVGALRQSSSFQATMAAVAAVTDATGADFDALRKKALDLGSSTSFSAQQVADGMQALGQGGFTVQETLSGIDGALLLARAGMLDLGDATSITVSVLRSFAMPTQMAAKVADVLAKAANSSNASVEGLGAGLSIVSGIAHTAGASLEETSAALGVLADRGADASVAGTAIRRIFMGLATEQKKLSALGVEVKDPETGKLKPLIQVFKDLKAATSNMDASERIAKLIDIFDAFGANAAGQLIDATDSLETLTKTLGESQGAARKAAGIMDDTLGGSMRRLMSSVEGVAIGVGDALTPSVREWAAYLQRLTAGIGLAVGRNVELVVQIAKLAAGSVGAGVALLAVGTSIRVVAFALGGLSTAAKIALSPLTMTTRTALFLGTALTRVAGMVGAFSAAWVANLARITAAAAINGVAISASFLAPFAGVAAVAGLAAVGIAGVAVAVGKVGGQSGPLFDRMSAGFQAIAAQAQKAFGRAFSIASTTVSGISDAITAGELSIAFDVLWAGLASAWASGQQGVMGMVDYFTEYVQNAWGNMQTYLIESLTGNTTSMEGVWGNFTDFLYDIWTGGVDKIVEYWNSIVNPIKRVIDTIRSYFDGSMDYEEVARQAKAANEAAKAGRSQRTQDRAGQRDQAAADAQGKLGKIRLQASGAKEAAELVVRATQAATGDELRAIAERGQELKAEGNITKEQYDRLSGAVDDQAIEMDRARALQSQEEQRMAQAQDMVAGAGGAVEQQTSKIDTAGTFNAAAIQGIGYSSNLAERTAKAAEETAKNTRNMSAEVQS